MPERDEPTDDSLAHPARYGVLRRTMPAGAATDTVPATPVNPLPESDSPAAGPHARTPRASAASPTGRHRKVCAQDYGNGTD